MASTLGRRVYARAFTVALLFLVIGSESRAQQLPVLGYVAAKNANPERLRVFRIGLHDAGYEEGKNIAILYGMRFSTTSTRQSSLSSSKDASQ